MKFLPPEYESCVWLHNPLSSLAVPPSGVVGVSVGAALLVLLLGAVSWVCYRRRGGHKKLSDRPLTLRRPTAVKNPAPQSHYLKKSPSPTGNKSPPGGELFFSDFRPDVDC